MFNLFEIASFLGRPVCLYEFAWGPTYWRYTSADRDITYGGFTWTAIPISDTGFSQGSSQQDFTLTIPRAIPVVDLFRTTPPSTSISLICKRFHKDDPDLEAVVYWTGTIGNVRGKDAISAEVIGLSISSTIKRTGLRLCWERGCPHMLYDLDCKVDKTAFGSTTTITGLTGTNVTFAAIRWPAANYNGGFLQWNATAEGAIDRRAIESFVGGTTFGLLGTTDRLTVGQTVNIYPGCDLTDVTCDTFFNNLPNNGAFKMLSGKSPFDGTPIF